MCYTLIVLYTLILHAASTTYSVSPDGYLGCYQSTFGYINGSNEHYYVFEDDTNDHIININACGADFSSEIYVYNYDAINETFEDSYIYHGHSNYAECGDHSRGSFLDNIPIQIGQSVIFSISDTNQSGGDYNIDIRCGEHSGRDIRKFDTVCSIGCNETVTGFYEYGVEIFCNITSSADYAIFDGCGSDYDQILRIWDMYQYEIAMSDWNNYCNDYNGYIEWNNWDNTITQYLQISGYEFESGTYSISMKCGKNTRAPIAVDCFIGCDDTVTGFIGDGETAVCAIHSSTDHGATIFNGCGSNYDQWMRIWNEFGWDDVYSDSNQHCNHSNNYNTAYIEWYNYWPGNDDQPSYYLEIGGNEAGNYSVSMQCNVVITEQNDAIFCGDTVSGNVINGEADSYRLTIDSALKKSYIMTDCDNDIKILVYDTSGYFITESDKHYKNGYNWICHNYVPYLELFTYGEPETFDIKIKAVNSVKTINYTFTVFCDNKPKGQIIANISCSDRNWLGHIDDTNLHSVYYNFINPKNQTVTFDVWSTADFRLQQLSLYDPEWDKMQQEQWWNDCPHLTYHDDDGGAILPAGDYIFGIVDEEYSEGRSFLLDIICDVDPDHIRCDPRLSNLADTSCNYIDTNDDGILPFDVCFGSHYEEDGQMGQWSSKYQCVNGDVKRFYYNDTANCDTTPRWTKSFNSSDGEYYCDAAESCPYVLTTFYGLSYDSNIQQYICAPNVSNWHKFPQVMDKCFLSIKEEDRGNRGVASSIHTYYDGNLTQSYFLGTECGANQTMNEYLYKTKVIQNNHCCTEQDGCEQVTRDIGAYAVIEAFGTITTEPPSTTISTPLSTTQSISTQNHGISTTNIVTSTATSTYESSLMSTPSTTQSISTPNHDIPTVPTMTPSTAPITPTLSPTLPTISPSKAPTIPTLLPSVSPTIPTTAPGDREQGGEAGVANVFSIFIPFAFVIAMVASY